MLFKLIFKRKIICFPIFSSSLSKTRLLSYLACNGCLSAEFEACFNAFSLRFTAHDHALHYKLQILHEYVLDMLNSALYLIIHHRTIFYTVLHPVVLHLSKAVLDPAGKCSAYRLHGAQPWCWYFKQYII